MLAASLSIREFALHMKSINPRIAKLKELMDMEERRSALQGQLDSLLQQMNQLKDALFDESAAPEAPALKGKRGPKAASEATAPAPRVAKKRAAGGRTPRGELKSQIVEVLKAAGATGMRVTDIAHQLGMKPVNVHAWFHAALSRYPEIKKVDRGQYRLDGDLSSAETTKASGNTSASRTARGEAKVSQARGKRASAGGTRRGALSERILSELSEAGAKGITVKELAEKMSAPYKNIYIWFATTGKKNQKVKKLGPATYRLTS